MLKKLWRSLVGCAKWVGWLVAVGLILNVVLLGALLVTPVMFFFFWKARSTMEVFEEVIDKVVNRLAEEVEKAGFSMHNDVEFDMEIDDDEDNLF
jgi:hypothetical protein